MDLQRVKNDLETYFSEHFDGDFEIKTVEGSILSVSGDFYCEELEMDVDICFNFSDCEFASFNFFLEDPDGDEYDTLVKINDFNNNSDMFYAFYSSMLALRHHVELIHDYDVIEYVDLVFENFLDDEFIENLRAIYE